MNAPRPRYAYDGWFCRPWVGSPTISLGALLSFTPEEHPMTLRIYGNQITIASCVMRLPALCFDLTHNSKRIYVRPMDARQFAWENSEEIRHRMNLGTLAIYEDAPEDQIVHTTLRALMKRTPKPIKLPLEYPMERNYMYGYEE